jgi:hypothetical protein
MNILLTGYAKFVIYYIIEVNISDYDKIKNMIKELKINQFYHSLARVLNQKKANLDEKILKI